MNKKGFTTVELVLSFAMVVVILTSLIGFTVHYRDKMKNEEIKSQLLDFKNTITKVIYDDIVASRLIKMEYCAGIDNCVNFISSDGNTKTLRIMPTSIDKIGVYLNYDGVDYFLPDSDLNGNDKEGYVCHFNNPFELKIYDNYLYNLKITFKHYLLNEEYEIMLTIN